MKSIISRLSERIHNPSSITSMTRLGLGDYCFYPSVKPDDVKKAEDHLGFRLPNLLRELYIQVGNGGFGPGYGIIGLTDGYSAMDAGGNIYSLVEYYYLYRRDYRTPELSHDFNSYEPFLMEDKEWFDKLLPICQWGCHHEALVDCSKPNFPVIHLVGYGGALLLEYPTFEGWIEAWIRGDDLWQTIANKLRNEDD